MKLDTPLDYAVFQLSPKRSRCELFVSRDGNIEKLASGLLKPFVAHLKIAEEHVALAAHSIKLEVDNCRNGETWFTKGTLERFVRYVSTPEVLEMVNTFDAEMSQLEAARVIYAQGVEDHIFRKDGHGATTAADATKKELLRAIDVRLAAVKQDLVITRARAAAAGFNHETISELQSFADQFGAYRLNGACGNFISLCQRRPALINSCKSGVDDRIVRSSYGSDMSIDDEPATEQPRDELDRSCQQHNSSVTVPSRCARDSSMERDYSNSSTEKEESGGSEVEPPVIQPGAPSRRLSVQDRISLFENKQKETSTGSSGKPVVAKSAGLRRLYSDVSSGSAAAEKAVLRRWSGVSDMSISIDLSGEKREIDVLECTAASTSATMAKPDDRKNMHSTANSNKPEFRSIPGIVSEVGSKDQSGFNIKEEGGTSKAVINVVIPLTFSAGTTEDAYESERPVSIYGPRKIEDKTHSNSSFSQTGMKDQTTSETQSRSLSFGRADRFRFCDEGKSKGSYDIDEQWGTIEQRGTIDQVTSETQIGRLQEGGAPQLKPVTSASKSANNVTVKEPYQPLGTGNLEQEVDLGSTVQSASLSRLRAPLKTAMDFRQIDCNPGSKIGEAISVQYGGSQGAVLSSGSSMKTVKETEEVEKQSLAIHEKQYASPTPNIEDYGIPRVEFQKQVSARVHTHKSQSRKSDGSSVYGNNRTLLACKIVSEDLEDFASTPETPAEQVQRIRKTKGNQELNDDLKMKANELEKLFAEHKLRAPGDHSNSTRKSKPDDMQNEQASTSLPDRKPVTDITSHILDNDITNSLGSLSSAVKFSDGSLIRSADNLDYRDKVNCNISKSGLLDKPRGKFYDKYMQKRDAKLREEWGSRRTEKEAKLKEMQESFERSRSEIRDKLSGSTDKNDSVRSARRRAERLRSFNNRSTLMIEQPDFFQIENDDDPFELAEKKPSGQDRSIGDASLGSGAFKSSQVKRFLPNRILPSSTPRTSAAAVQRSTTKASNSASIRRRTQAENPLVQSVPNFSDLRKENTKPYSASKTARPQVRNYNRSNEEIPHAKEEKTRLSHSIKKTTASPAEFRDASPLDRDIVDLSPRKFDTGSQTEQSHYDKFVRCTDSKSFLQKNNSIRHGSGAGDTKLKASMMFKPMINNEESDESLDPEESAAMVKDGETILTRADVDQVSCGNREPSVSQKFVKSNTSGSENGDALQSTSQVDTSLFLSSTHSTFHAVGSAQESPGESPMSWNSHIRHPFSYPHEGSDIDASVDSPLGSPASWNLHMLNQTEADAARMRKKWGSAQKPMIGANLSGNQSRKDMTRGFKRLLKFGRKSRGTESLADWISATTSEGDDDTEVGRDPANRSSEDLRKSRMGFSQDQVSDECFRESVFLSEQALRGSIPTPPPNFKLREDHLSGSSMKAPHSFFSLSSFRSKGSESKHR